jgi:hypothetical protein
VSNEIGENDYRLGGQERLREAKALLDEDCCAARHISPVAPSRVSCER